VKCCADKGICDAAIVRDTLGPYAAWHWPCLKRAVDDVRRGQAQQPLARPDGHGLETLAIRDVGSAHCGNLKGR
jgi:hypothetical protein